MHKNIRPTLLVLLLASLPAYAQFEGVVQMKMAMAGKNSTAGANGTITVSVAKAGARSEANMQMGPIAMKTVTLQRADTTNTLYRINDANKTYTEVDLAKTGETAATQPASDQYTVEKLGQETVLGYQTQHVLVKEKNPSPGAANTRTIELWTAKDVLDYATFSKLQARRGKADVDEALVKALKDAGADGLPLKCISTATDGGKVTMEVVKVDKQSLPGSTFEIPAGYTKSAGGAMDKKGDMFSPQAERAKKQMDQLQQNLREAMKTMTPEQRAVIEKRMKQLNLGNQ
jgi:hypothetical protein